MPKLDFKANRSRTTLELVQCSNAGCSEQTYDLAQNTCTACGAIICFECSAIKRNYCCTGYIKRYWPGLMSIECKAVNDAIEAGNRKALEAALADFGVGSTDDKVLRDIADFNARMKQYTSKQRGCRDCQSTYVKHDGDICASCMYWVNLAAEYGVTVQIIRIVFKSWNTREYYTFAEYMQSFDALKPTEAKLT